VTSDPHTCTVRMVDPDRADLARAALPAESDLTELSDVFALPAPAP
jgi:hypothetical protein